MLPAGLQAQEFQQRGGAVAIAGDKVAVYYACDNRDENHFNNPYRFIIDRTPNEPMAFGKDGPHFCLGTRGARLQVKVLLEEMRKRVAAIVLHALDCRLKLQMAGLSQGHEQAVIRGSLTTVRSVIVFYLAGGKLLAMDCIDRPKEFLLGKKLIETQPDAQSGSTC